LRSIIKQIPAVMVSGTIVTLLVFIFTIHAVGQVDADDGVVSDSLEAVSEIRGFVLDLKTGSPLAYTNIYVAGKQVGTISNEKGIFSLNADKLISSDTVVFQYVGYQTRRISVADLQDMKQIFLKEEIFNLSELLIFAEDPDVVSIVKKVLENKEANYKPETNKRKVFIRNRLDNSFNEFELDYKKSSIDQLDREAIALFEEKMPRNPTSYTDLMGELYFNEKKDDSIRLKIDPLRVVSLEEPDITELEQIADIMEEAFANTGEGEYWKVKSGIFGSRLDSADIASDPEQDSINENRRKTRELLSEVKYGLGFSSMDNKRSWEFLHKTGKYKYTLAGGIRVNGEDAYIIDFSPGRGGRYEGRMIVTMESYALIRADYQYAAGKTGKDFQMLGVGFTEKDFVGSIFFEKKGDNYLLKYFSVKMDYNIRWDRSLALLKKKKRFMFNKRLKEIKVGILANIDTQQSTEFLMLEDSELTTQEFHDFQQPEYTDIIYVEQFDDDLWKGFSIIEPTGQMRDYKKQSIR
jgi:hypothetical protein